MSYRLHGFRSDPFSNKALPPDEIGELLMVDREQEVNKLIRRIQEGDNIPTLEGPNGVGKTSIVNVALHRAFSHSKANPNEPMFIPCRCSFQINQDKSIEDFIDEIYLQISLTLIEQKDILRAPPGYVKAPIEKGIQEYINAPIIRSYTATIMGQGAGMSATPNTGKGWER